MIEIRIGNSYSRITGLTGGAEKILRKTLSYTPGGSAAYFSSGFARTKCLIDKQGHFPTGLVARVLSSLSAQKLDITISDLRKVPKLDATAYNPGLVATAYKWQKDATTQAVAQHRGIISAPTGTGKSRTIAMICSGLGLKTLIVVPSLEIKKQLRESLKILPHITIENIDSTSLQTMTDFDCLIIDEAHHVAAKTYQKLNKTAWTGIYYRFFMTATPFRNDNEETLLFESIAGNIIYQLDYKTAIKEKYIVPVEAYYIESPKKECHAYGYSGVYSDLVVNNTDRNELIAVLLLRLKSQNLSTLCLVKEVKHGRILAEITGLPFINGEDNETRRLISGFSSGKIPVIIATEGIMSEGVDSKACEYVVIAGSGKAKSNFMQKVGRAVRNYPGKESAKVILIKDKSHKYMTRHFAAQKKILLDEYGVVVLRLDI